MPIHGIMGMLDQIGTFFIDEMVGRHSISPECGFGEASWE
jgi:hypothetical protein